MPSVTVKAAPGAIMQSMVPSPDLPDALRTRPSWDGHSCSATGAVKRKRRAGSLLNVHPKPFAPP